jgi:hypothetical protein
MIIMASPCRGWIASLPLPGGAGHANEFGQGGTLPQLAFG